MGGTGKTPQVEYLIRLLRNKYTIATLSRGYKRKTSGFIIAANGENVDTIGDEPLQYKTKFPELIVAVDENRRRGINRLLSQFPDLDVILLDDAFQHRSVKPGFSILLTDYHKPLYTDYIFPAGTLRESKKGIKRANIIIVSKTPRIFSPITRRSMEEKLKACPGQSVFYSFIKYSDPVPLNEPSPLPDLKKIHTIVMLTGIANPDPMEIHLRPLCTDLITLTFPDHHQYTKKDLTLIRDTFDNIINKSKIIITTEKDAMRMRNVNLATQLIDLPVSILPVEVEFHQEEGEAFDKQILDYIAINKRKLKE